MESRRKIRITSLLAVLGILGGAWGAPFSRAAGSGPAAALNPTILNFPSQLATTTSAPQTSTLTNTGDQPLAISSIAAVGTFAETNNCPASLAANASCTISITFTPVTGASGEVAGLIIITDNALPGPQAISLGGLAANFSLAASPSSNTVSPGQSATYTITVTPSGGFSQSVSLACGALPAGANCGFSPASVTPGGSSAATSTLTISTSSGSQSAPQPWLPPRSGPISLRVLGWLLLAGLGALALRRRAGVAGAALTTLALLAALAVSACGGGSSSGSNTSVATPAGSYTVLVTGTTPAGTSSVQNPVSFTLVVN